MIKLVILDVDGVMTDGTKYYDRDGKVVLKLFGKHFSVVKNRLELDYPELYDPKKLIPVEGKAGTLIVFDSDLFHQGGKINKKGLERIVLRMHNYLS